MKDIIELLNKLNIQFKDKQIYETAFTHKSYANEYNIEGDYERLEFLGDKVIDLIISEYLYLNSYIFEGEMTKIRASYVCENALSNYALKLDFANYIKLGKGEYRDKGNYKESILADIFEAFVGALYIDLGIIEAKKFIEKIIINEMENNETYFKDYKSLLQEYVQTTKKSLEYILIDEKGPSHEKEYTIIVKINNIVFGKGIGKTKKEAEQKAAKDALNKKA